MNILCASDGSDGGYRTTGILLQIVDRQAVENVRIVLVTWPQRKSSLWSKAYSLWLAADDLHQAMEITVETELERFKALFRDRAVSIETENADGDPVEAVLTNAKAVDAGLILLAITGDVRAPEVRRISSKIIEKSSTPVVVAYGGDVARA